MRAPGSVPVARPVWTTSECESRESTQACIDWAKRASFDWRLGRLPSSVAKACQEPQGTLAFVGQRELWVCR
jgi:hypothetical protein